MSCVGHSRVRKMIIAQILGGLGNQMFQYAFGRRLADGLGVPLKLDVTAFHTHYRLRRYGLDQLCIAEDLATAEEIRQATKVRCKTARRLLHRMFSSVRTGSQHVVQEKEYYVHDPAALDAPDGAYLAGYWQSEKYFATVAPRLRVEFRPRRPLTGQDADLATRIAEVESVSLHVRRGDYVLDPVAAARHDVCDERFYERCIAYLADRLHEPHFFLFSDDPEWTRENLHVPFPSTVVSYSEERPVAHDPG